MIACNSVSRCLPSVALRCVTVRCAGLFCATLLIALCGCDSGGSKPVANGPRDNPSTTSDPPVVEPEGQASSSTESAQRIEGESGIRDPDSLYEDWPEPQLVLFVTGQQHGYIEPCGCTGLENQKGGLARRHTLLNELHDRGWPLVVVDAGNQVRRFGRQAEIKFQVSVDGLATLGYDAITFGIDDLRLSTAELMAATAAPDGESTPFLCANVALFDTSFTQTHRVVERAGLKIGITGVLGDSLLEDVKSDEVIAMSAREGLEAVASKLSDCDLRILLAHATYEESEALGRDFPQFDVVVTAGGTGDPPFRPKQLDDSGRLLVRVGEKGMFSGLVAYFANEQPRFRYQRLPLTHKYKDSPEMMDLLATYQSTLEDAGLEGLEVRPLEHPSGREFVGSQACADCHDEAYEIWENSPHHHATESLTNPPNNRSAIPRHHDPECLSCHVTGWNPQRYFPYRTGYLSVEETPSLQASGCENCHGPGSRHVAAENGDIETTEEQLAKIREGMRLPYDKARQHCLTCHDLDNSPEFQAEGKFEEYWEQIEH